MPTKVRRRRKFQKRLNSYVRVNYSTGEEGWIVAECPDLPGCVSQGRTLAQARKNIADAIEGWLEVEQECNAPVQFSEFLRMP